MSNLHGFPDTLHETQCIGADLLPAIVLSNTYPTVPVPPSMTLPAFATVAYVRESATPARLIYVNQPAAPVTLVGADGGFWLAVHNDTHSAVSGWSRQPGTHYIWRASPTLPAVPSGALLLTSMTVTGGAIVGVNIVPHGQVYYFTAAGIPALTPLTDFAGTLLDDPDAATMRATLGLGTMATQNANAVAITGGTAAGLTSVQATGPVVVENFAAGSAATALRTRITAGTNRWNLYADGTAPNYVEGPLIHGAGATIPLNVRQTIWFVRASMFGQMFQPLDSDGAGTQPVIFQNVAGTQIGSISTTGTTTAYNTTSDRRLKTAIAALEGALATVLALRPVQFTWEADARPGQGFLADEVQALVPQAVTGEADAVHADGTIVPQGMDSAKLVPFLVGACQELAQQVQVLTARLSALEGA